MRRAVCYLCLLALAACSGAGIGSHESLPTMSDASRSTPESAAIPFAAARTWNVQTGASHDSFALQDLDFYPKSITIDAGDSIAYTLASGAGGDAHTVSFVPPGQKVPSPADPADLRPAGGTIIDGTKFVNSGLLVGGQTFTLKFAKAGTYRILCLFHEPAMVSTVIVNKTGTPYPHDATFYREVGITDEWQDFGEALKSVSSFPFTNGGTTLAAGSDPGLVHFPPPDATVLRFLNSNNNNESVVATAGSKTIKVGTVLTWVNETSNEPHTVTFPVAGAKDLPNIPPDPAINVAHPPAITTFDGTKLVNSGTFVLGQRFSLKFTKPGSYFYGCIYHDNSRMNGTITVVP